MALTPLALMSIYLERASRYIRSISDILGQFEIYRVEKVVFPNLGLAGGAFQIIRTLPLEQGEHGSWRDRGVQPECNHGSCILLRVPIIQRRWNW
jgi:hypothetical protein